MPSIADIRKQFPTLNNLSDYEVADIYAKGEGISPETALYELGLPPPNAPGFVSSVKRSLGQTVQGLGQVAEDVFAWQDNPVKNYGNAVISRNPSGINSLEDIAEDPWLAVREAAGGAVGYLLPAGAVGIAGKAYGLGRAGIGLAQTVTAGVPSYGGIRQEQIAQGNNEPIDMLSAAAGAGAVGWIEQRFGLNKMLGLSGAEQATLREMARAAGSTPLRTGLREVGKAGLQEGAEELLQNPIEQVAAYRDPTSRESLEETAFGGVMGTLGGLALGGAGGVRAGLQHGRAVNLLKDTLSNPDAPIEDRRIAGEWNAGLIDRERGTPAGDSWLNSYNEGIVQDRDAMLERIAALQDAQQAPAETLESRPVFQDEGFQFGLFDRPARTPDGYIYDPATQRTFQPRQTVEGEAEQPFELTPATDFSTQGELALYSGLALPAPAPKGKKGLSASSATAGVPRVAPTTGVSSSKPKVVPYDVKAAEFERLGGSKSSFGRVMSNIAESYGFTRDANGNAMSKLSDDQIAEGILNLLHPIDGSASKIVSNVDAYVKIYQDIIGETPAETAARREATRKETGSPTTKEKETLATRLRNAPDMVKDAIGISWNEEGESFTTPDIPSVPEVAKKYKVTTQAVWDALKGYGVDEAVRRKLHANYVNAVSSSEINDNPEEVRTADSPNQTQRVNEGQTAAQKRLNKLGKQYADINTKIAKLNSQLEDETDPMERMDLEQQINDAEMELEDIQSEIALEESKKEKPNAKNGRQSKNVDAQAEETGDAAASETRVADEGGVAAREENEDAVIAEAVNNRTADGLVAKAAKLPVGGKRVVRRNADLSAGVTNNDELAPEIRRSVGAGQGTTVEAINKALREWFFSPKQMADKLVVVQKWDQLPTDVKARVEGAQKSISESNGRFYFSNESVSGSASRLTEDDDVTFDNPDLVGTVFINGIDRSWNGKKGRATNALQKMTTWADANGETLSLIPSASGDLKQSDLEAWYERNGFVKRDSGVMVRTPTRSSKSNATTQGFIDPVTLKAYLIADNIDKGEERSVFMHEVGSHLGLTEEEELQASKRVRAWRTAPEGSMERSVYDKTMKRMADAGEVSDAELVAYATEEAVNAGIAPKAVGMANRAPKGSVQEFINYVARLFMEKAKQFLGIHTRMFTAQDLVDLTYGAARITANAKTEEVTFSKKDEDAISKLSDAAFAHYLANVTGNPETIKEVLRHGSIPASLRRSMMLEALRQRNLPEQTGEQKVLFSKKIVESLPTQAQEPVRYVQDALGDMARRAGYASIFTNDLVGLASKVIPSSKGWYDQVLAKAVEMTKREALVDEIATDFDKLDRGQFTRTWKLIHDMTTSGKWGYSPTWRNDVTVDADMEARYKELTANERDLMDRVFKYGDETLRDVRAILDKIVEQEYQDKLAGAKTDAERVKIRAEEGKFKRMFGRKLAEIQGPYAPMRRVGSHVVVAKSQAFLEAEKNGEVTSEMRENPLHYTVMFRDSFAEVAALARELKAKGFHDVRHGAKVDMGQEFGQLPFESFDKIRDMAVDKAMGGELGWQKVADLANELYLTSLAETSARKSEMKRLKVAGLENDPDGMFRAFISKGKADAHYIGVLKNGKQIADTMAKMRTEASQSTDPKARDMFNELTKRYANGFKSDSSPLIGKLMKFNTIWMLLTKPAYYLYNMTQPVLMTSPYLTQKFGSYTKANSALMQAYQDLMKSGIDPHKAPADVNRAMQDLLNQGKIDITIVQDLGSRLSGGHGKAARGMAFVDRTLRTVAQKTEMLNRLVTGMAAYRLAKGTGKTHEAAVRAAAEAIDATQGNYDNFNAPRIMNQVPVLRLITQFRKFQLIQASFLVKMFNEAVRGGTPHERAAARKGLMFIMAHHAVLAGALGLPAANLVALAFSAMGDDDEPKDLELWMREQAGDPFLADLLTRGLPAAMLNVNVSGNVGMGQTFSLLPYTNVDLTSRSGMEKTLVGLMGPTAGLLGQGADALGYLSKGDYYKGLAGLLPGGIKSSLNALNEAANGMTNKRGDVLIDPEEISLFASTAKALGFKTMDDSVRQLVRSKKYEFEQFFNTRSSELKNEYAKAYRDGDGEKMQELRESWTNMQQAKRDLGFTTQPLSTLLKAPAERAKRERNTADGVQYNKASQKFVERFAGGN